MIQRRKAWRLPTPAAKRQTSWPADKPPHKGKIDWLVSYYEERVKVLNVDVRLNTEAAVR